MLLVNWQRRASNRTHTFTEIQIVLFRQQVHNIKKHIFSILSIMTHHYIHRNVITKQMHIHRTLSHPPPHYISSQSTEKVCCCVYLWTVKSKQFSLFKYTTKYEIQILFTTFRCKMSLHFTLMHYKLFILCIAI